MNKTIVSVAVASVVALSGCAVTKTAVNPTAEELAAGTHALNCNNVKERIRIQEARLKRINATDWGDVTGFLIDANISNMLNKTDQLHKTEDLLSILRKYQAEECNKSTVGQVTTFVEQRRVKAVAATKYGKWQYQAEQFAKEIGVGQADVVFKGSRDLLTEIYTIGKVQAVCDQNKCLEVK